MKQKKNSYPPVNVGSSFMLVILVILCMVVFAILSLSGALRDSGYSSKTVDRTTAYYQANNIAEEKLAEIDYILSEVAKETEMFTLNYKNAAISSLNNLDGIIVSADESDENIIIIQYSIPIGEEELLQVSLTANDRNTENSGYYYITEWKQLSTKDWNADSTLPLMKIN